MATQNSRDFEFKLGKLGLVLFTLGISLLLFFSFIFGVMVGKNMESYPEKIAKGVPRAIKEKITDASNKALSSITETQGTKETKKTDEQEKPEKIKLDFYNKLTEKEHDAAKPLPKAKSSIKTVSKAGEYTVQVASFKDKSRMEKLKDRLTTMGYSPKIDETDLTGNGKWFRVKLAGFQNRQEARTVVKQLESKIRGLKCMIIHKK